MLRSFRFSKRKKAAGRRRGSNRPNLRVLYPCALVTFVLAAAGTLVFGYRQLAEAPFFRIETIAVSGCSASTPGQIRDALKIRPGDSIITANLKQASAAVERHPWVRTAVVRRKLPDTITVVVTERVPVAVMKLDGFYLVDSSGTPFKQADHRDLRFPLLEGFSPTASTRDSGAWSRVMGSALCLVAALQQYDLERSDGLTISMDPVFGLSLVMLRSNIHVSLGFDNYETKLAVLGTILDDLSKKGTQPRTIHLTTFNKAYVTLRG